MNAKKKVLLITMIGLLGATTAASASTLISKVSGSLRNDVKVSVSGKATTMKPVIINGQVYLPARSEAEALGYTMNYDEARKSITINKKVAAAPAPAPVKYLRNTGVIVNVQQAANGQYRIELLGKGDNSWVILYADKDTVIKNKAGKSISAKDLKKGQKIDVQYGPSVAMTYPVESHAAQINVSSDTLIREDVVQAITRTGDGWSVQFAGTQGNSSALTVTSGKETSVLSPEGQSIKWEDVKVGSKVRVYYGVNYTNSKTQQGPLYYMVVLNNNVNNDYLSADAIKGFRGLAWNLLSDKSHLLTKQSEAKVELVDAKGSGVMTTTDAQKKSLEALQSANGKLVTVTYNTDQDAMLGPIVLAFNPNTKEFIGFYPRR